MYKFLEDIYPQKLSYFYARSVFSFFQTQEHSKEFFKYLFYRLNSDYKKRVKGEDYCLNVLRNDNNNYPLIDINYNFLVLVLAEWIDHYSFEDEVVYEYSKYKKVTSTMTDRESGDEIETIQSMRRDLKIVCSIKERVMFDYSFSGWLVKDNLHKNYRFDLMQVLFNNILGKHTYVASYNYRNRAVTVKNILVYDELKNRNILFASASFFRSAFTKYLTNKQVKTLIKMGDELSIINNKKVEKNDKNELEFEGKKVEFCSEFDIENIEKNRDENDGKYHSFEESEEAEA